VRYKDDDTKPSQDYRDHLNHFDALLLLVRVVGDPGFMPASSGPKMVSPGRPIKPATADLRAPAPETGPRMCGERSGTSIPRSYHRCRPQALRSGPAGFPSGFGGRAELLTLLFMLVLF
jgi:hypothetical protein